MGEGREAPPNQDGEIKEIALCVCIGYNGLHSLKIKTLKGRAKRMKVEINYLWM